jgi:hypothetical protein
MYRQPGNEGRVSTQPATGNRGGTSANRPNNVVAGKDGSVYRQNGSNWQSNQGGQWKNSSSPSAGAANRASVPADVGRTQQARTNGQQRTQSYNNARSSGGGSRSRGGGGGRGRP